MQAEQTYRRRPSGNARAWLGLLDDVVGGLGVGRGRGRGNAVGGLAGKALVRLRLWRGRWVALRVAGAGLRLRLRHRPHGRRCKALVGLRLGLGRRGHIAVGAGLQLGWRRPARVAAGVAGLRGSLTGEGAGRVWLRLDGWSTCRGSSQAGVGLWGAACSQGEPGKIGEEQALKTVLRGCTASGC
jgi:hypothetical protein